MHKVAGAGERIERFRFPAGTEIEHYPDITDFDYLWVAADTALLLFTVGDDRFGTVAIPVNHVP
jgi:hypothetical protein